GFRCTRHVSLQRCHDMASPSRLSVDFSIRRNRETSAGRASAKRATAARMFAWLVRARTVGESRRTVP
ncbi:MAG: hypothetical protein ACXWNX_02485, partial [Isosphaeraceae bacterium]